MGIPFLENTKWDMPICGYGIRKYLFQAGICPGNGVSGGITERCMEDGWVGRAWAGPGKA